MNEVEIYTSIRNEISSNNALMHWYSIITALAILVGIWVVENRKTILSIFLPLLSVAWAAAMVRFDFFIQRQGAYLRALESQMLQGGSSIPLWESWKVSLRATPIIVPIADIIACAVIVVPTIYILFGPAQKFFQASQWRGGKVYAWSLSILLLFLLGFLAVIPKLASWGH